MPRFEYKCSECEQEIVFDRNKDVVGIEKCSNCGSSTLVRVYSFNIENKNHDKNKAGVLVKSHIEEAKKELKLEKDKLTKRDFKV